MTEFKFQIFHHRSKLNIFMVSDVSMHVIDCMSMFKWTIATNTITPPAPTVV